MIWKPRPPEGIPVVDPAASFTVACPIGEKSLGLGPFRPIKNLVCILYVFCMYLICNLYLRSTVARGAGAEIRLGPSACPKI